MRTIIIDGRYMKTKELTHIYLKEKLQSCQYYGDNLDAIWDVLSSYSDPIEIKLINKEILIETLGDYGKSIVDIFTEARDENSNIKVTLRN